MDLHASKWLSNGNGCECHFQNSIPPTKMQYQHNHNVTIEYAAVPQTLEQSKGLVIRQEAQIGEAVAQAFGIPYEAENRYKVSLLPNDKNVKENPNDPHGWEPSAEEIEALEPFLFAREKSGLGMRTPLTCLGCGPMRPLKMHFAVRGSTGDAYLIDRPFKLGGCCCMPFEMTLDGVDAKTGQMKKIGRVRENFSPYLSKCCASACLATTYTDIDRAMPDGSFQTQYILRTNTSCCGRVNNCCGATCLKNDAVYDILDTRGEVVAHLQMTYGGGGSCLGACCRASNDYNNYMLEFPPNSTAEDRMLLLAGLFQTLEQSKGLVIRQEAQIGEAVAQAFGIPYEAENRYKVSLLPNDKNVKENPNDPHGWEPSAEEIEALEPFLFAREKSGLGMRTPLTCLGCGPMRPLKMHFAVRGSTGDAYLIDRPFKLGGCCCMPFEMTLDGVDAKTGQMKKIGRVRENFSPYLSKCCASACLATTYTDIDRAMPDGSFQTQYILRTNTSCCGRVNNCCGATCLKNDAVYDILDTRGEVVAHLQMTYGGGGSCLGACCRASNDYNNYMLEFPPNSTAEDRMLLLAGLFQEMKDTEANGDQGLLRLKISEVGGVVVRQQTQKGEAAAQAVGLPFESRNKYTLHLLPHEKQVKSHPNDANGWEPSAQELAQLEPFLFAQEESGLCSRVCLTCFGCGSLRALTMHFSVDGSGDVFLIRRPFAMGGCCCCPLEMRLEAVSKDGRNMRIGRVREDFAPYLSKCCSACCLATTYTDIDRAMPDGTYEKRYSLRTNLSCCGRVNNCCGATCFKNDAVYDILDNDERVVAHLQRTFANGSNCLGACCRMGFDFNNFLLEFPSDSTPEDRLLLLTALFQVEYQLFERKEQ
ncbi:TPA: hypothetical protein N0F65_006344 [Lagenidium giganteum]|uniref:Phospholipid scramblase n=1 Tax=Lagenidium giganteum TaxID=4803 RepID=A0AAV2YIW4_9STRA|nr:TPA: hypothetical protein N0F65_006344 [Lagenidium giganteum]